MKEKLHSLSQMQSVDYRYYQLCPWAKSTIATRVSDVDDFADEVWWRPIGVFSDFRCPELGRNNKVLSRSTSFSKMCITEYAVLSNAIIIIYSRIHKSSAKICCKSHAFALMDGIKIVCTWSSCDAHLNSIKKGGKKFARRLSLTL